MSGEGSVPSTPLPGGIPLPTGGGDWGLAVPPQQKFCYSLVYKWLVLVHIYETNFYTLYTACYARSSKTKVNKATIRITRGTSIISQKLRGSVGGPVLVGGLGPEPSGPPLNPALVELAPHLLSP